MIGIGGMKFIIGISAYYHDSAAALLVDGEIVSAAHEERFTRIKHDPSFPVNAIKYVLSEADLSIADLSAIAFYDKPYIKFERLLETYHAFAPKGLPSFLAAIPVWIKEKLFMKKMLWDELENLSEGSISRKPSLFFLSTISPMGQALFILHLLKRQLSSPLTGWGNGPRQPSVLEMEVRSQY